MSTPSDDGHLRVSNSDRTHVTDQLQKAVGAGMLDLDEFAARADKVLAATTRADLARVVEDLPGVTVSAAQAHPDSGRVGTVMSSVERAGRWVVPRVLDVRNTMGTTKIDLVDAIVENRHAVIDVRARMGTVVIIAPEGSTVDTSELRNIMGTVKNRIRGGAGGITITVRGSVTMGTVKIRPPLPAVLRNLGF